MSRQIGISNNSDERSAEPKRQYGCPCGKTYLSYPALFTHVKHKHDGKAPGNLIKPETGKIRGRPKTRINPEDLEMIEISEGSHRQILALLEMERINYDDDFVTSEGNTTCQDAASKFFNEFVETQQGGLQVLSCFLNELRSFVNNFYGQNYWEQEPPSQIIEVANTLYTNHEEKQTQFPLSRQVLKELIFYFFQWLFANRFTDHRLQKRSENESKTQA